MTSGFALQHILVVDDEVAIRRFLRTSLSAQGFQVLEAENGRSALDQLKRHHIDLVILDLGLPDLDGEEIIGRLRQSGAAVPILVLSSRTDEPGKATERARYGRRRLCDQAFRDG